MAACTLVPLVYDSILTIPDEVDLIWRRKPSVASVIFVLNRMAILAIILFSVLEDVDNVCRFL